jgi:hypothetical protein
MDDAQGAAQSVKMPRMMNSVPGSRSFLQTVDLATRLPTLTDRRVATKDQPRHIVPVLPASILHAGILNALCRACLTMGQQYSSLWDYVSPLAVITQWAGSIGSHLDDLDNASHQSANALMSSVKGRTLPARFTDCVMGSEDGLGRPESFVDELEQRLVRRVVFEIFHAVVIGSRSENLNRT